MSARVNGSNYDQSISVTVECPARESSECGMKWEECGGELECEQSAGGLWTIPTQCPSCGRLIQYALKERVIRLGEDAIDNFDGAPAKAWHF